MHLMTHLTTIALAGALSDIWGHESIGLSSVPWRCSFLMPPKPSIIGNLSSRIERGILFCDLPSLATWIQRKVFMARTAAPPPPAPKPSKNISPELTLSHLSAAWESKHSSPLLFSFFPRKTFLQKLSTNSFLSCISWGLFPAWS